MKKTWTTKSLFADMVARYGFVAMWTATPKEVAFAIREAQCIELGDWKAIQRDAENTYDFLEERLGPLPDQASEESTADYRLGYCGAPRLLEE